MIRAQLRSHWVLIMLGISAWSISAPLYAQQENNDLEVQKAQLIKRIDTLLFKLEDHIQEETTEEEMEAKEEAKSASINNTDASSQSEEDLEDVRVRLKRDRLRAKLEFWTTGDRDFIGGLKVSEINELMAEARSVAAHFGLNVERYGRLYDIGKKAIRESGFVLNDHIPPDQKVDLVSRFNAFFTSTAERRAEIAEFRAKLQEYKLGLTKRVTFAYIRALLAAPDAVRNCDFQQSSETVDFKGQTFRSLGCEDPVLTNLKKYVQAVQNLAGAEAEFFAGEADYVIAEQTIMNDLAAGIPLLGDAIDLYSIYSGENLAGQCLDRTSLAITAVFSLIPFVPASWWTYGIKRFGLEEHISKMTLLAAEWAEYGGKNLDGFVAWTGVSERTLANFQEVMFTEINVFSKPFGISGRGKITKSAQGPLAAKLSADEIAAENLKLVQKAKVVFDELPDDVRAEAVRRSKNLLRENLEKFQKNKKHVVDASNMVPEHIEEFIKLARQEDSIIIFRSVNPDATVLIANNAATKWMDVKPKSADWGPHRGYLPFDQNFSKLRNPDKLKNLNPKQLADAAEKAASFSEKSKKCITNPNCFKIPLELPNKNTVHILQDGVDQIPVLRTPEGKYLDPDLLTEIQGLSGELPPMEVIAGKNAKGELVPLTADYDLLAVGNKKETHLAMSSDATGNITPQEQNIVNGINEAGERAGYTGGDLSHHGPENQFHLSEGALSQDPVVTAIHPKDGPVTIPRCDRECFVDWCRTSKRCGAIPVCRKTSVPDLPCLPVDPDRLLKDFMQQARLDGYTNLRPNATWDWGEANGLSGWAPRVMLEYDPNDASKIVLGQYSPGNGLVDTIKKVSFGTAGRATQPVAAVAKQALKYMFSCPDTSVREVTQKVAWKLKTAVASP